MLELLNRSGHAIEFCFKEFERNMIYKHFRGRVRVHAYIAYLGGVSKTWGVHAYIILALAHSLRILSKATLAFSHITKGKMNDINK